VEQDRFSGHESEQEIATSLTRSEEGIEAGEVLLATLVGIDSSGQAQISFELAEKRMEAVSASATVAILPSNIGRQVAVMFLTGDINQPVVIGFVHNPLYTVLDPIAPLQGESNSDDQDVLDTSQELATTDSRLEVDGETLDTVEIEGKEQVVLRCGDASITLTKAGKILLRGKYLVSRSSGVNRIFGGSVQVN